VTLSTGFAQRIAGAAFISPTLGAPGIYFAPGVPAEPLSVESMDVAAFVGVAPRGPAWETTTDPGVDNGEPFRARSIAVPVESWDDYVDLFSGFEGPGLLPHAVSAYFAQGGRRAYVVRVVGRQVLPPKPDETPPGCASFWLGVPDATRQWLIVDARSEGGWGNRLAIAVSFTTRRLVQLSADSATWQSMLRLPIASLLTRGATLCFTTPASDRRVPETDHPTQPLYSTVLRITRHPGDTATGPYLVPELDPPVDLIDGMTVDVVEADVSIVDADPTRIRSERFQAVGLSPLHPRNIVDALNQESRLVQARRPPDAGELADAISRRHLKGVARNSGFDLWADLTPDDMFPGTAEPVATGGIDAVASADEVATIVVPDLYFPATLSRRHDEPAQPNDTSTTFTRCVPREPSEDSPKPTAPHLAIDPTDPDGRKAILTLHQRLVDLVERMRLVVLLDVPPNLNLTQVLAWRAGLQSQFAAAYHPWLAAPAPFNRTQPVPPSAVAAGVIANSELTHGIARGPANEIAVGVVDVNVVVAPDDHATLHRLGVNVFLPDVDGIRLTGARTLSGDSAWRQLTVRRLLLAIARVVNHQLQWTVFEPNGDQLRDALRRQLDGLMAQLAAQGCFAGATPEESWFVSIASGAEARREEDAGQLIVEIGVAPSEPMEFIVVRVAIQAEGEIKSSFVTGLGVSARA